MVRRPEHCYRDHSVSEFSVESVPNGVPREKKVGASSDEGVSTLSRSSSCETASWPANVKAVSILRAMLC